MPHTVRLDALDLDQASAKSAERKSFLFSGRTDVRFQGGQGELRTELATIHTLGLRIASVISTGHEIDLTENEDATFLVPRKGRLDLRVSASEYSASPGNIIALRPSERRTRATATKAHRFRAALMMVPMTRLDDLAQQLGERAVTHSWKDGLELTGAAGRHLSTYLAFLADDLVANGQAGLPDRVAEGIDKLINELLHEVILGQPPSDPPLYRHVLPALHRVRAAEDYMRAHSDDPLSVADISAVLGVGLRSLQLAFQAVHGNGPRHVLNRIRLERSRQRLLHPDDATRVTSAAFDSGLSHLGRFAGAYRATYGENPAETLANARRRSS